MKFVKGDCIYLFLLFEKHQNHMHLLTWLNINAVFVIKNWMMLSRGGSQRLENYIFLTKIDQRYNATFKYCRLEMILNSSIIAHDELIMGLISIILWIKPIFASNLKQLIFSMFSTPMRPQNAQYNYIQITCHNGQCPWTRFPIPSPWHKLLFISRHGGETDINDLPILT